MLVGGSNTKDVYQILHYERKEKERVTEELAAWKKKTVDLAERFYSTLREMKESFGSFKEEALSR